MVKPLIYWEVVSILFGMSFHAFGADSKLITIESLIGKYEGVIRVVIAGAIEHPYTTEILSVDKFEKTVSLSAYCADCDKKELKRSGCKITEVNEIIRFVCKGLTSDEEYTFDGTRLEATGFGNKYPYAIDVGKVNE